jgi:hypothetical protein
VYQITPHGNFGFRINLQPNVLLPFFRRHVHARRYAELEIEYPPQRVEALRRPKTRSVYKTERPVSSPSS